jgi:type IV pilus assembly protein PilZ
VKQTGFFRTYIFNSVFTLDQPLFDMPHAPLPPFIKTETRTASTRPSVIQLAIREKAALYAAYIPVFTEGGVFVPTSREYKLGDDVYILLTLPEDTERHPVAGKVAWITPSGVTGNRTPGVGVRFPGDKKSEQLKFKIEGILGAGLATDRPTQTI